MSIPPGRALITILGQKFGWGRFSRKKTLLLWWTGGFVLFFLIGQIIENGYFENGDVFGHLIPECSSILENVVDLPLFLQQIRF